MKLVTFGRQSTDRMWVRTRRKDSDVGVKRRPLNHRVSLSALPETVPPYIRLLDGTGDTGEDLPELAKESN